VKNRHEDNLAFDMCTLLSSQGSDALRFQSRDLRPEATSLPYIFRTVPQIRVSALSSDGLIHRREDVCIVFRLADGFSEEFFIVCEARYSPVEEEKLSRFPGSFAATRDYITAMFQRAQTTAHPGRVAIRSPDSPGLGRRRAAPALPVRPSSNAAVS